ncbi:MAG: serine hydrolase, partial [Polaromonas sp.]|nr:serine hydrolase [Polaromonas sp.]
AVASREWGPRAWAAKKNLLQAFVRDSGEYKAARDSGLSEEQALKQVQADPEFLRKLRQDRTRLQAGFVALNPRNGHVMAWVGSRGFAQDQFDHVQQARRQPGSTFKPFVYGAAFEQGALASDTFMDQAVEIPLGGGAVWRPTDGGPPSGLSMSLRDGLVYSKNTITAQVMQSVGAAKVAKLAQAMGVRQSKLEQVPSLALGTSPVTLREMVSAYSTIANGGKYIEPLLVTRIEDRNGRVLEKFSAEAPEQAMSTAAAHTLLDVMRGVVDRGTGSGIRSRYGIQADVAGKTGTTQDNTDGWFILMHPNLVAGAWVGFNDNRVTLSDYWGQGAHSALPIVGDFFQQSLRSKVVDQDARFDAPRLVRASVPEPVAPTEPETGSIPGDASLSPLDVQPEYRQDNYPSPPPPIYPPYPGNQGNQGNQGNRSYQGYQGNQGYPGSAQAEPAPQLRDFPTIPPPPPPPPPDRDYYGR